MTFSLAEPVGANLEGDRHEKQDAVASQLHSPIRRKLLRCNEWRDKSGLPRFAAFVGQAAPTDVCTEGIKKQQDGDANKREQKKNVDKHATASVESAASQEPGENRCDHGVEHGNPGYHLGHHVPLLAEKMWHIGVWFHVSEDSAAGKV